MKNAFLVLALALGAAGTAQAQSVRLGLKAGASLTGWSGAKAVGSDYKFGFNGGVMANFGLNDMISIQPEVLYSMKGAKYNSNSGNRINSNYIDVPVLVKIATGATGLFFELGPQVGFLASANNKTVNSSLDIKDSYKTVDFGYAAGLGYQVASGPMIGLRYNGGFTDFAQAYTVFGYTTQPNLKNSAFQLYVGYLFGGK